ncbi:pectate lyase-like protein [Halanaerobium saccharolyticum]|uniref:Pectate lyase-like protein n=1 Tax=Halanaerobium saccharolyticum TaxID=43595 RepID=A0A4R6M260_9FIRM|nr:glycosyl hydrolase family 28-related protein [Halanaerobium saccharolyticum]TDO93919.1 pectate lyase-like protein [Halanaerobium saccharolyticum]
MLKNNFEIEVRRPEFPDREFDIKEFGGVPDGKFDNTEVFAEAIASCYQAGGGTIVVPAGDWFTGPIHFKSNVHLKLEADSA